MHTDGLNRKQRRALQFGAPEERAAIIAEINASLPPKVIKEVDGRIVIPYINDTQSVEYHWMIPYKEIDRAYNAVNTAFNMQQTSGDGIGHYYKMLSDKFYCGLQRLSFTLKPNVYGNPDPACKDVPLDRQLLRYVFTILADWGPAHEHKFAYCTYALHMCCSHVEWTPADR